MAKPKKKKSAGKKKSGAKKKKAGARKKVAPRKAAGKKKAARKKKAAPKKKTTAKKKATGKRAKAKKKRPTSSADEMAEKQRDISVSEFFAKNRHLLGFDNPSKALLTTVKEGVDNALDACEEAGVVPEIRIEIQQLAESRFRVALEDNGPGIVREQVPKIFGRLLYGSKFHRLRQSRGQQGIGISAAGMYGLLTTGKPVKILTKTGKRKQAHEFELVIDTQKNKPQVKRDVVVKWPKHHGTRVEIELEGHYRGGQHSVDNYIRQISLANPHAQITYVPPVAEEHGAEHVFPRVTKKLPAHTDEIQPHPYGIELGVLMQMFRDTESRNLASCLRNDFSRVSPRVAAEICERAGISPKRRPGEMRREEADSIYKAIKQTRIMSPPTDCIAPIGEDLILAALKAEVKADFYSAVTRRPTIYRGNPFLVEVGLAYGGEMHSDDSALLYRYANRVPLQYQQGACAITRAVSATNWKSYLVQHPKGALPVGPLLVMVHIASVWVPFTSESKDAVAQYPEIIKEFRFALQECGRKMTTYLRKQKRAAEEAKKAAYIEKYIPQVAIGLQEILSLGDRETGKLTHKLTDVLERSRKL
ncbi:MAG: DNA topoisomerase VI subunit B [Myxococcota bacterium]|jgi:DNA topoisomerase VI subunit B|nr:DNA topoisomerase VI subunit B [Myxococcota bacterium]